MLFSLISALFVSANYYTEAADKSACITQISQYQKAVRGYQNLNGLAAGSTITHANFYGEGKPYTTEPSCPLGGGSYTLLGEVPANGVAFAICADYDISVNSQAHTPTSTSGW